MDLGVGRYEAAYHTLSTPVAEEYPILLAFRAAALAGLSKVSLALEDIDLALKSLPKAWDPDAVRVACADAALIAGDEARATKALAGLSRAKTASSRYAVVRGRMAFATGDVQCGRRWFEEGAERDRQMRSGILAELGGRLFAAGYSTEAVEIFSTVEDLPRKMLPTYVNALIGAHKLAKANEVVRSTLSSGDLPEWALAAAIQIAILRDDLEGGVTYLKVLMTRPGVTHHARLELLGLLLRLRRLEEARELVKELKSVVDQLDGRQQMALAQATNLLGEPNEGLRLAFSAYRKNDDDPELHRALATLALQVEVLDGNTGVVVPDSYVKLRSVDGDRTIDYTILESPPVRARDRQILAHTAETLGLMGRAVGDTVTVNESWGSEAWKIEYIAPAVQHVVQDILANYGDRFPTEEFFVKGFSVAKGGGGGRLCADYQVLGREGSPSRRDSEDIQGESRPVGIRCDCDWKANRRGDATLGWNGHGAADIGRVAGRGRPTAIPGGGSGSEADCVDGDGILDGPSHEASGLLGGAL